MSMSTSGHHLSQLSVASVTSVVKAVVCFDRSRAESEALISGKTGSVGRAGHAPDGVEFYKKAHQEETPQVEIGLDKLLIAKGPKKVVWMSY